MKRVLVTGGAGYIGSHACKALARAGYEPVTYDNLTVGHRWAVRWGPLEVGDLGDAARLTDVLRTHRPDTVVHFAASAYVGESMRDPGKYFRNNVANTLNLLEAMERTGVGRLVVSSSCATFGVPDTVPIAEGAPQRPVNVYGESKLAMERVLHWYGERRGLRYALLRYFNAAGADPDGEVGECHDPEPHLIPIVLQAAAGRRECVRIYGTDYPTPDGTCVRDYVHVTDLADMHLAALRYLDSGKDSTDFNLGTGIGYSIRQVIGMVEKVSGKAVPVAVENRRSGDPPVLYAAAEKAGQGLGWKPRFSDLPTIVETAWRWETSRAETRETGRAGAGKTPCTS